MERIDELVIIRLKGFFDEEFDDKLREDSLDFFFERDEGISGIRESRELVFTIVVKKEVSFRGVDARFAKTVFFAIFFGDVDKLLMRLKFNITIKFTSREDNRRGFVNIFAGEFNLVFVLIKKRF